MVFAFLHGVVLAFGLILPLGPQNAFVLAQGATQPRFIGALPVVVTAALADTCLILLAVLGVSVVLLAVSWVKTALVAAGVVFLCYLGWTTWRSASRQETAVQKGAELGARRQVLFALSVSLLNPHAILDTIGVIGTSSLAYAGGERLAFTAACISVSCLWFFGLALAGRTLGRIGVGGALLARFSAVVMWISAAYLAYYAFFGL